MTAPSTASTAPIAIPWDDRRPLTLELPPTWPAADVVWPDLDGDLDDYPAALGRALDEPEGGLRLDGLARPGTTVAIVVDDPSRWTPVREALPILLGRLHAAGIRARDVSISVGVGRHLAVDAEAMRLRVGADVAASYRCFSPPVDDRSRYDDLGRTPGGVPVRVFRPVAEADVRILIGSVLPHLQAGFGGGYKLIFPGTSHRTTLGALHRMGLGGDAGRLLGGEADQNPMRR
ncbi:MAG TPA: lactate racemase domain-containing protein, partial [Isosphaeraceae bacterium]